MSRSMITDNINIKACKKPLELTCDFKDHCERRRGMKKGWKIEKGAGGGLRENRSIGRKSNFDGGVAHVVSRGNLANACPGPLVSCPTSGVVQTSTIQYTASEVGLSIVLVGMVSRH